MYMYSVKSAVHCVTNIHHAVTHHAKVAFFSQNATSALPHHKHVFNAPTFIQCRFWQHASLIRIIDVASHLITFHNAANIVHKSRTRNSRKHFIYTQHNRTILDLCVGYYILRPFYCFEKRNDTAVKNFTARFIHLHKSE